MNATGFYFIKFDGIETSASIGLHAFEMAARQRLLVRLTLVLQRPDRFEDRPETVLDYDFVREGIAALVSSRHYKLQEALCEDILDLCLRHEQVQGAVVQTGKPDVYADVKEVSCRLGRMKPGLEPVAWWTIDV